MNDQAPVAVQRWTRVSTAATVCLLAVLGVLAFVPLVLSANATDKLTTLFIYVILAAMWNALAGYAGLVSVGQQAFFGLGAYATIRLTQHGMGVYPALVLGALLAGAISLPLSLFMLRLKGGEFAVGMWVVAEVCLGLVILDKTVAGLTGVSLIAINHYGPRAQRDYNYWMALGATTVLLVCLFLLLRSRTGFSLQAIRDDEEAARSVGVRVLWGKGVVFVLAALGCAMAGTLWLATNITFQPASYFSVQWTAYMIFMALVGGLGTFEGPIIGAIVFFVIDDRFGTGNYGVWYLVGLGVAAILFALFLPRGIWGTIEDRFGIRLLPVGYRLRGLPASKRKLPPEGSPL
ncbi:MAG: branched-chain amino acid ABC transporter permease [Candidatus Rokuibacteriota bacterium]|nr:MAG: branched-chain amino acid ABC transporter permease [Candidatus Rokubacteria bacterium]